MVAFRLFSLLTVLASIDAFTISTHAVRSSHTFLSASQPRHDVGMPSEIPIEIQERMSKFQAHQQAAPRPDWPTDVRTLVQYNHGFAVMSTNSKSDEGYPGGSVVGFAPDDQGRPIFIFSGMSTHTQDVLADPRCSLTIADKNFKSAADARVNFMGKTHLIKDAKEKEQAREIYLRKHPGAFWVDFGDFNWFRMDIEKIRFVGGFARAGSITASDYTNAKPDAIAEFGTAIASHMNEDHMDAIIAMVYGIPGMEKDEDNPIKEAVITSVDSLGMYVKVTRNKADFQPQSFKLRMPFPRAAKDRKDVKTLIVEMTQAAASTTKE